MRERLGELRAARHDRPLLPHEEPEGQSQIYDRGCVSLACFRSKFGGLVLGCMDSYDSNQIFIFHTLRDLQDYQNTFPIFGIFANAFAQFFKI